jgi:hypothetical protein
MKVACIIGEYYLNKTVNVGKKEWLNLQDDMKELRSLLETVTRSLVKEVVQHKVNGILVKMATITNGSLRNKEYNLC